MESSRLTGLIDGVTGNLLTDAVKQVARPLLDKNAVRRAIRRTAADYPYYDVERWLPALTEEIPDVAERGRPDLFAQFATRCSEVARTAGNVIDFKAAGAIARCFFNYLDEALTAGEHDQRERERTELLSNQLGEMTATLRDISQAVSLAASHGTMTPPSLGAPNTSADHEIVAISALVSAGLFVAADERLAKWTGTELTDDIKFRVATLSGICAHERGNDTKAVTEFETARDLRPSNAAAVSNLAAAYLSINDGAKALIEARNAWLIDPDKTAANYIAALHYTSHEDAIAAFIPDDLDAAGDANTVLALARVFVEQGNYSESERFARRAVELSGSPVAKEVLAVSLIGKFGFSRLRASADTIRAAEQLLTEAIDARKTWQTRDDIARCLLNRAVMRCLARDYSRALHDVERSLDEHEMSEARALRARVLTTLGRHSEAIVEFERVIQHRVGDEIVLAYAQCLIEAGRAREALPYIDEVLARSVTAADRLDVVQIGITAASALDDVAMGESYVLKVEDDDASRWVKYAAQGYLHLRRGSVGDAISKLTKAVELAPADESVLLRINLARAQGRDRRWSAAAASYATFVTHDCDIEIVQSFAAALYSAGRYDDLLCLYDQCAHANRLSRQLRELRARVYEDTGDLLAARELYLCNAMGADGESEDYLRAAVLSWRLQDCERARELISKIAERDLVQEPRLLMLLAEINDALGVDPLRVAYMGYIVNESAPDIPAEYVRLYRTWRPEPEGPALVVPECAITLALDPSQSLLTMVVTDDPMHASLPRHCGTSSERGRTLLGRAVGEVVVLPFDGATSHAKIVQIVHKLDFAYRDAIESSRARFGAAAHIGPLDDEYVATLKDAPESKALRERRHEVQRQYRAGTLALGAAADRARIPVIRFFCRNMSGSNQTVQAFTGVYEDAEHQRNALQAASEVVLDLTAIITLARVDLLGSVAQAFSWLGVTQWTVDSLLRTRRDVFGSVTAPTVGILDGDAIVPQQVDQNFYDTEREMLDRCIAFVRSHASIVSVPEMVQVPRRKLIRSFRKYGRTSARSVFAAARRSAVLLIDDVVTQQLAADDRVTAVGTQVLLEVLRERSIISHEQYVDALATLSALNYRFIRLGSRDLYVALTALPASSGAAFAELVRRLGDPECDERSAIRVGAGLLCGLWQSANPPADQKRAATAALVLVAGLTRGPAVGFAIRDAFLTSMARTWYEAAGRLDYAMSHCIGAMHYGLRRLETARSRIRPRLRKRAPGAGKRAS